MDPAPGLLSLMILGTSVREVQTQPSASRIEFEMPDVPRFRLLLVALFIFTIGSSTDSFLLWRPREIGISVVYTPLLRLALAFFKVTRSIAGGEMSDRLGRRYTIVSRWLLYAAVYLGFALASAPWHVRTVFVVYGLFFGLTEGAERAPIVDLVPGQWRGRALGWYQAVVGIGLLPANLMFGVLYQYYGAGYAFTMG